MKIPGPWDICKMIPQEYVDSFFALMGWLAVAVILIGPIVALTQDLGDSGNKK